MEDKFQRGLRQLAEAGHDKDKLGMSLISLHGALEEHFRNQLAAEIAIEENELGRRRTDWQDLLNLWQRHRSLSYHDRELIFAKNTKRNAVAHGDPFEINRSEMEQYAQFVQKFTGIRRSPIHTPSFTIHAQPTSESGYTEIITNDFFPTATPKRPIGWIVFTAVLLVVAFATFLIWNSWITSLLLTGFIFFFLRRRQWWRTGYAYVGGLAFGYAQSVIGLTFLMALVAALCWPLSGGALYLYNGSDGNFNPEQILLETTDLLDMDNININTDATIEADNEATVEEIRNNSEEEESAIPEPASNQPATTTENQLEVIGNSNVRAEPDVESAIVGYAQIGEKYDILETMSDNSWYKIRLSNGNEGWIGSTRIRR